MKEIIQAEVMVVGAGLVGLSAALAMQQAGYAVVLVDSQQQVDEKTSDWDQRIYAISPKNATWLASLGVWQLLDKNRIGEMQAMEIWGDVSDQALSLFADDANVDAMGFIVEERALKRALMQRVEACDVRTFFGEACESVCVSVNKTCLTLANQQAIEGDLLLAADGANSWMRQQLNISVRQKPYHQTAIVANFETEKPHNNIARQWFMQDANGHSGVLAWLPLPDNKISIVWSASTQLAQNLLKTSASEFSARVQQAGGSQLGELTLIGEPAGFPLVLKTADEIIKESVVFIGDAAHRIHPMAGQGVNLGFRGVVDLLTALVSKHSYVAINDQNLLKHYARLRKADLLKMLTLTNGLYHLFESENKFIKKIRNWGLNATNQSATKKLLVRNAIEL